ncbi:hypothetical protein ACLEE4_08960 [Lonsdalea quercina]|uniref:hypothetical protein n=1 Tax=Lonsdalea quercina TaxID=71657 RepID=UPI003974AA61
MPGDECEHGGHALPGFCRYRQHRADIQCGNVGQLPHHAIDIGLRTINFVQDRQ